MSPKVRTKRQAEDYHQGAYFHIRTPHTRMKAVMRKSRPGRR